VQPPIPRDCRAVRAWLAAAPAVIGRKLPADEHNVPRPRREQTVTTPGGCLRAIRLAVATAWIRPARVPPPLAIAALLPSMQLSSARDLAPGLVRHRRSRRRCDADRRRHGRHRFAAYAGRPEYLHAAASAPAVGQLLGLLKVGAKRASAARRTTFTPCAYEKTLSSELRPIFRSSASVTAQSAIARRSRSIAGPSGCTSAEALRRAMRRRT
jgi:hypothetical protein